MNIVTKKNAFERRYRLKYYRCYCNDNLQLTPEQQNNLNENLGMCDRLMKNYFG